VLGFTRKEAKEEKGKRVFSRQKTKKNCVAPPLLRGCQMV
jgi:hypothetical protein